MGDEADVLAVWFVSREEAEALGVLACFVFALSAKGEAEEVELVLGGGEEEIALVFAVVMGAVKLGEAVFVYGAFDVVSGGHAIGAEVVGDFEEVAEFDALVAAYAGDGGLPFDIAIGEVVDDAFAEFAFVIEDVVREAAFFGNAFGVVDVLSGAAGFCFDGFARAGAHVVELERYADNVVAFFVEERGNNG